MAETLRTHAIRATPVVRRTRSYEHSRPRPFITGLRRTVPHDRIAARAYELWQADGHCRGKEFCHWLEAEAQLKREMGIR